MSKVDHNQTSQARPGLHDSVSQALQEMITEHRPSFPGLSDIAARAGQDEEAVRAVFGSVQDILDTLAEQGLIRLFDLCVRTITKVPPDEPVEQFRAVGTAYLDWAFENQAQFLLLQHNKLTDIENNERLARYSKSMRDLMMRLLGAGQERGQVAPQTDLDMLLLSGRCLLFGLARMGIDQNMADWHPGLSAKEAAHRSFAVYIERMGAADSRLISQQSE